MPENPSPFNQPFPVNQAGAHATAPVPGTPAPPVRPHPSMLAHLQHLGLYVLALAGVWVATFLVLYLLRFDYRNNLGFSTVAALLASFFVRSFLPRLEKHEPAHPSTHAPVAADSTREVVETVVFVVVLVLLLRSFAAEAFVIPTGSMAETLYGYQKEVRCPSCQYVFPVNCSQEVDPTDRAQREYVSHCTCPNCLQPVQLVPPNRLSEAPTNLGTIPDPGWQSGDRVLVGKFAYDLPSRDPDRLDVVVFKYPGDGPSEPFPTVSGPYRRHVAINYIKRLIGLPGETIAIHRGKLWRLSPELSPRYDDLEKAATEPGGLVTLWRKEHMHRNDPAVLELFQKPDSPFTIIRKKPENLLSMRRLVFDNEHQPRDITAPQQRRWQAENPAGWTTSDGKTFQTAGSESLEWLRYQHLLRGHLDRPQLITDFMGYNSAGRDAGLVGVNWASDLLIECQLQVERPGGQFLLELSRGNDRFQAVFDLTSGECTLLRLTNGKEPQELGKAPSPVKKAGTFALRFANVDDRLTVWVNDKLLFGDGVEYGPVFNLAPTVENDLNRPARLGAQRAYVRVNKLRLYRDTYYTTSADGGPGGADLDFNPLDPADWPKLGTNMPVSTYYVQPGHYLCLGDNSPASSDGRSWGLVPKRLLLGRALLVYYPFTRAGRIR